MKDVACVVVSLSCLLLTRCHGARNTGENRLYTDLIWTNNRHERPVLNKSDTITVSVDFHLKLISHFDETRQHLICAGFLSLTWTDEFLAWDPALYSDTEFIRPSPSNIWTPDVVASNSFQPLDNVGGDFVSLKLYSTGKVEWMPGDVFSIPCDVDVSRYPFDTLACYLELVVWEHAKSEVTLKRKNERAGIGQFMSTGRWTLLSTKVREGTFRDSGEVMSKVTITLNLDRSSTIFVFSFILPVLVLSLLGTFVFLIPSDSGEKISFAITIPLSYGVYMGFLTNMVPQTAQGISIFLIFLGLTLVLSAIFVILSIISVRISMRNEVISPLTSGYVKFVLWIEAIKGCRSRRTVVDVKNDGSMENEGSVVKPEAMTWKRVGRAVDLLFLWLFCIPIMISISLVIMFVLT